MGLTQEKGNLKEPRVRENNDLIVSKSIILDGYKR